MYKIVFPMKYVCFYKVSVLNYILNFDESHASITFYDWMILSDEVHP